MPDTFPNQVKGLQPETMSEANAGMLAREWCRIMQYFWDLYSTYGSWEAAGGPAALDGYREEAEYSQRYDRLPHESTARAKALELRKLRPRDL